MLEKNEEKNGRNLKKSRLELAFRKASVAMALFVILVCAVGAIIGAWILGPRIWPTIILVVAVGSVLAGMTSFSYFLSLRYPDVMMAWVAMDFLIKLITLIVALYLTKNTNLFHSETVFYLTVVLVLGLTGISAITLARSQVPLRNENDGGKQ